MKRYHTILIAVAALLMGPIDSLLIQDAAAYRYYGRSCGPRSLRTYGVRPYRDFRKERKEKMENLEKSKTKAMENEMWHREYAGLIPGGWYGTAQIANMSAESKELLKQKKAAQDQARAEAQAAAREQAEAARAQAAAEAAAPPIQKAAMDHIKAMSNYLAKQDQFEVFADELREEARQGQLVKIQTRQHMQVARPDRLRLKSTGLGTDSEAWFDGEAFTIQDKASDSEMDLPLKTGVSDLGSALYNRHGYVLPMADLLMKDLFGEVEPYIARAKYMGLSNVGGVSCHHVAASSGAVDWEAWIQAEGDAVPRRLFLRYLEQPGTPRYGLTVHKMQPLKEVTEATFAKPVSE